MGKEKEAKASADSQRGHGFKYPAPKNKKHRKILSKVLKEQYSKTFFLNSNLSIVDSNINLISQENTYTITTGHQLNIFAGPLFLIYKIITVISHTMYMNKEIDGYQFIPCFWMATEDHDFQEIKKINLFNNTYTTDFKHEDCVGNLQSKPILSTLSSIKEILQTTKYGKELLDIYEYVYTKNLNYANATRALLTALFGDYGLVIIDGNNIALKKIFIPDFKSEINNNFVYKNLLKTNKIIKQNYNPQINPSKSNIFYFSNLNRSKIQCDNDLYFTNNKIKKWSKTELLNEIEKYPDRFSPNVFLRTMYQERIMPNILYVGGPSEISYWLQLKRVFDFRKLTYPILSLRSHFLILSKKTSSTQVKLELNNFDIFLNYDDQLKKIINYNSLINIDHEISILHSSLLKIEDKFKLIKGAPINSFFVFQKRLNNELNKLKSKMLKFEKTKHDIILRQLTSLNNEIFPNKSIQERSCSFLPYYIKYGKRFFDLLIKEISIFDNKYIILKEEDLI